MRKLKHAALVTLLVLQCFVTGCSKSTKPNNDSVNDNAVSESDISDEAARLMDSSLTEQDDETRVEAEEDDDLESMSKGDVVEIKEKMFATMCDEIYVNTRDYLGKTIKIEGIADESYDEEYKETITSVYRNSPGCCGNDGWSGFEYLYDGELPKKDDWIEVIGTLESYELDGQEFLRIKADSVTVKEERGAEFVSQ